MTTVRGGLNIGQMQPTIVQAKECDCQPWQKRQLAEDVYPHVAVDGHGPPTPTSNTAIGSGLVLVST